MAPSSGNPKCEAQRPAPNGKAKWSRSDGRRREKALEPAQPFFYAVDGCRVRNTQIAGRSEGIARHHSHLFALEQMPRECSRISRAVDQVRGHIRESIKRPGRFGTGDAGNGAQAG